MNDDPITEETRPPGPATLFIDAWVAERHRAGYVYTEQLLEIARGLAAQIDGLVGRCEDIEGAVSLFSAEALAEGRGVLETEVERLGERIGDLERRLTLAEQVGVQTAATWTASVAEVVPDLIEQPYAQDSAMLVTALGDSTPPLIKPVSTGAVAVKGRHARVKGK